MADLRHVLFAAAVAAATSAAAAQGMAGMDHGAMRMQGGPAPADARDPDAYSDPDPGPGPGPADAHRPGAGEPDADHGAMRMADQHRFGSVLFDRLERGGGSPAGRTDYDVRAWWGDAYDKAVLKAEGETASRRRIGHARTELLWGHAVGTYWDTQLGLRADSGRGLPGRGWLAFGIQGLAPYWFELEATAYLGEGGRTAARFNAEYELLITQRLILQPRAEAEFHGRDDPAARIGAGLSSAAAGLRLRYEFGRQFAPYLGVERAGSFGRTAGFERAEGVRPVRTRWVAGVRLWF